MCAYPDEAKAGGAAIVGTGRSDFDNQINNALAFISNHTFDSNVANEYLGHIFSKFSYSRYEK